MAIRKDKFYDMVNSGKIQEPIRVTDREFFWYSSYVRNKVEEYKS